MWIKAGGVMNLLVGAVGIALGVFIVVAPQQVAMIWGSERLEKLAPPRRVSGVRVAWRPCSPHLIPWPLVDFSRVTLELYR